MKKILFAVTVAAAALVSTSAMAQAYVSADVGIGHASVDCSGTTSCDKNGTSFKVTGGYKLGYGLAAELGYIDFGKVTASDVGVSAKITARAWTLGAAYEFPFTPEFAGVARLGVASVDTKASATVAGGGSGSVSETKTQAYYGLGANYAVAKNVKIEGGVDWSHASFDGSSAVIRSISAGVRYEF